MLEIRAVYAGYDGNDVVRDLDFTVAPGTIVALIGANGAGKSTTLKALSGLIARRGHIEADGTRLRSGSSEAAVRAGVVHVPEGRQVFANLTVADNLALGAYAKPRRARPALDKVLEIFPELSERMRAYAGSLSGGQQQMLAIGRGLMSEPRYLLLDEPSLGLAPTVVARIFAVIDALREDGKGILLVEQNGRAALAIAQHACLLESGTITMRATGSEMLADSDVVDRDLGVGSDAAGTTRSSARVHALATALQSAQGPRRAR